MTQFLQFLYVWIISFLSVSIPIHAERNEKKVILFQTITEDYLMHPWEWDRSKYPYSIIDLSKISVYSYAQRHGYDYQFLKVSNHEMKVENRSSAWVKLFMLRNFLNTNPNYDYVVVTDVDGAFIDPSSSILDKLQLWSEGKNIDEIDAFFPADTDAPYNYMIPYGSNTPMKNLNSGFQVWKISPKTIAIVNKWYEASLPGCEEYLMNWPYEQGVLNYMKLWLKENFDLKIQVIPCSEANGFPSYFPNTLRDGRDLTNYNCSGSFFAHFWEESKRLASKVLVTELAHQLFQWNLDLISKSELWLKESSKPISQEINFLTHVQTIDGVLLDSVIELPISPTYLATGNVEEIREFVRPTCLENHLTPNSCDSMYFNILRHLNNKRKLITAETVPRTTLFQPFVLGVEPFPASQLNPKERVLLLQVGTEDYIRHDWEWSHERYPYSIMELSKVSIYSYAKRHGYDYHYVKANADELLAEGRPPFWIKVYALKKLFEVLQPDEKYDLIVILDVDMAVMDPDKSVFEKMNEWREGDDLNSIDAFFSDDVDAEISYVTTYLTKERVRNVNSGFQIWRNSKKNRDIVHAWYGCPLMIPGCDIYLKDFKNEQSALTYMYDWLHATLNFNMKRVPCHEVNGFPPFFPNRMPDGRELGNYNCSGNFISHYFEESKRHAPGILISLLAQQMFDQTLSEIKAKQIWIKYSKEPVDQLVEFSIFADISDQKEIHFNTAVSFSDRFFEVGEDNDGYRSLLAPTCQQLNLTDRLCEDLLGYIIKLLQNKRELLFLSPNNIY